MNKPISIRSRHIILCLFTLLALPIVAQTTPGKRYIVKTSEEYASAYGKIVDGDTIEISVKDLPEIVYKWDGKKRIPEIPNIKTMRSFTLLGNGVRFVSKTESGNKSSTVRFNDEDWFSSGAPKPKDVETHIYDCHFDQRIIIQPAENESLYFENCTFNDSPMWIVRNRRYITLNNCLLTNSPLINRFGSPNTIYTLANCSLIGSFGQIPPALDHIPPACDFPMYGNSTLRLFNCLIQQKNPTTEYSIFFSLKPGKPDNCVFETLGYNKILGQVEKRDRDHWAATDTINPKMTPLAILNPKTKQYQVFGDGAAYQSLPADAPWPKDIPKPKKDIYGNAIDYTKPLNAGCIQSSYVEAKPDYPNSVYVLGIGFIDSQQSLNLVTTAGKNKGTVAQQVFRQNNANADFGFPLQYGTVANDRIYLSLTNAGSKPNIAGGGLLMELDAKTLKLRRNFETLGKISDVSTEQTLAPRFILPVDTNTLYVSTGDGVVNFDLKKGAGTRVIGSEEEGLAANACGTMLFAANRIWALSDRGILVIDPASAQLLRVLMPPVIGTDASGKPTRTKYTSMAMGHDGKVYLSVYKNSTPIAHNDRYLMRIDPATLDTLRLPIPEGIPEPNMFENAGWVAGSFTASPTADYLFWTSVGNDFMGYKQLVRYDIAKHEAKILLDLSTDATMMTFKGSGVRVDPRSGHLIVCKRSVMGKSQIVEYTDQGEPVQEFPVVADMQSAFAHAFFADVYGPEAPTREVLKFDDKGEIAVPVADLVSDKDSPTGQIYARVVYNEDPKAVSAHINNGKIHVRKFNDEGASHITVLYSSNTKQTRCTYFIGKPYYRVQYPATIEHGRIAVYNGATMVPDSTLIKAETKLRVTVSPQVGYMLQSLTAGTTDIKKDSCFVPTADTKVMATFRPIRLVAETDPNGTLSLTVNGSPYAEGLVLSPGDEVRITATPKAPYELAKIMVNGTPILANDYTISKTAIGADIHIKADFRDYTSVANVLAESLRLYPSPATDVLSIELPEELSAEQINVYDLSGRIIISLAGNGSAKRTIAVHALPQGKYILRIAGISRPFAVR